MHFPHCHDLGRIDQAYLIQTKLLHNLSVPVYTSLTSGVIAVTGGQAGCDEMALFWRVDRGIWDRREGFPSWSPCDWKNMIRWFWLYHEKDGSVKIRSTSKPADNDNRPVKQFFLGDLIGNIPALEVDRKHSPLKVVY